MVIGRQKNQEEAMKSNHPKLKTPLFSSCGLFRHCSQTTLSPTATNPPPLPLSASPPPPPPPPPSQPPPPTQLHQKPPPKNPNKPESSTSSSSSSSASTSQSFTQWRFPLANSPIHPPNPNRNPPAPSGSVLQSPTSYQELFHLAELRLATGSEPDRLAALHLLERSIVPNPPADPACPLGLMRAVVGGLRDGVAAKPATKILLALCLAEANRRVAVEAGAVGMVVEVAAELEGPLAERALAALELACTVEEGVAELRAHALAVPVMVSMMGKMAGRGKEYAISALAVVYGSGSDGEDGVHAPAEEVARAVALALQQGDCTERGRRKGSQLLKALKGEAGRSDLVQDGNVGGNQRL